MESGERLDHSLMTAEELVGSAEVSALEDKIGEMRNYYVRNFRVWIYRTVSKQGGWRWVHFMSIYSSLGEEEKMTLALRFKMEVETELCK